MPYLNDPSCIANCPLPNESEKESFGFLNITELIACYSITKEIPLPTEGYFIAITITNLIFQYISATKRLLENPEALLTGYRKISITTN